MYHNWFGFVGGGYMFWLLILIIVAVIVYFVLVQQKQSKEETPLDILKKRYAKGDISQITFTSEATTFNAFSKASTSNFFGLQHEQDPNKNKYLFLVLMDNDIIVTPGWDLKIRAAWQYIVRNKMRNIKVVGQRPGGIKNVDKKAHKIAGEMTAKVGRLGGSGLWSVRPDFFRDVGF